MRRTNIIEVMGQEVRVISQFIQGWPEARKDTDTGNAAGH
jgi:hypothetical protein